jgi:hypothetical protein
MKKTLLAGLLCFSILSACKKKTDEGCGISGGIIIPNTYLFWIDHDHSCGQITVEVKDAAGTIITPYSGMISYTAASAPACNSTSYSKYATFDLYQGKNYTYKAVCSGKSWTGTISVPCNEQGQCKNILLQ